MPRGRTQHPTPDLFSEASAPEPPPTPASQVSSPKAAAVDKAKRRGKLPSSLAASDGPTPRSRKRNEPSKGRPAHAVLSLTGGQVNAVRAAFNAGIAPPRIAREFGISQSEVRKVLTSDARQRGRES